MNRNLIDRILFLLLAFFVVPFGLYFGFMLVAFSSDAGPQAPALMFRMVAWPLLYLVGMAVVYKMTSSGRSRVHAIGAGLSLVMLARIGILALSYPEAVREPIVGGFSLVVLLLGGYSAHTAWVFSRAAGSRDPTSRAGDGAA